MDNRLLSFVANSVYPNLTKEVIESAFAFLQPENVNGEHYVMHCPQCNSEANYYVKTGALCCQNCGSLRVDEIYAHEHGCRHEEAVRLLCLEMNIKIPLNIYQIVAPKSIRITQAFKELTVPEFLPDDIKKLGFTESEIIGNRHLSFYKSSEQVIDVIRTIHQRFPKGLADNLAKFENQLVVSRFQFGCMHLANKENVDAPSYGYIQNFEPDVINKGHFIATDDMLTAVMAWHYGFLCAYFSPNRPITDKQFEHIKKYFLSYKVTAIWSSEMYRSITLHDSQIHHYFPWLNDKQNGAYNRIREVIINVC